MMVPKAIFKGVVTALAVLASMLVQANMFKPSVAQQIKMGEQAAAQIRAENKVLPNNDPRVIMVRKIAAKIVATFPSKEPWHYSFTVLQSPTVNAFALPGGPMFFYTGLLDKLNTEDELAGVIGHELTHVRKQHWANMEANVIERKLGVTAVLLLLRVNTFGSGVADLLNNMYTLQYSRGDESQADEGGFQAVLAAGYNPQGMVDLFHILDKLGKSGPEFISDHPSNVHRIEHIQALIKAANRTYAAEVPLNWSASVLAADKVEWDKMAKEDDAKGKKKLEVREFGIRPDVSHATEAWAQDHLRAARASQ